jgi:hypothetical protein
LRVLSQQLFRCNCHVPESFFWQFAGWLKLHPSYLLSLNVSLDLSIQKKPFHDYCDDDDDDDHHHHDYFQFLRCLFWAILNLPLLQFFVFKITLVDFPIF